jgi:hypothetical protein
MDRGVLAGEPGCVRWSHYDPSIGFKHNQPEPESKNEFVFEHSKDNLVFYHSSGEVYGNHYSINYNEQLFTAARR